MDYWRSKSGHYYYVLFFTLFCVQFGDCGRRKRDKALMAFTDCGGEDKIIHFNHVDATPHPVVIPGTLYVSMAGNVTADLPRRLDIHLGIRKYFLGYPFLIPCLSNGVGSCSYENICLSLEKYEAFGCPRALRHHNMRCHCPFMAGEFDVQDVPINLPKIQGFAAALLNGDYELEFSLHEEAGAQLGCLKINFSMKKRHRGWLFKI